MYFACHLSICMVTTRSSKRHNTRSSGLNVLSGLPTRRTRRSNRSRSSRVPVSTPSVPQVSTTPISVNPAPVSNAPSPSYRTRFGPIPMPASLSNMGMRTASNFHAYYQKMYKPTDTTKRHRLADGEDKDEYVMPYSRRPGK